MDGKENTEFVNVGMEQPVDARGHEDVVIKVDGPSNGKGWKIMGIILLVVVLGLGAGLTYVFMNWNDAGKKVDAVQADLDARVAELDKFKRATGVENADDFAGGGLDLDLTELYKVLPQTEDDGSVSFDLNNAYIKDVADGKYQIAYFPAGDINADGVAGSGWSAYFYRVLPSGEWKYSGFSGNGMVLCEDLEGEDIAAFEGVLNCTIPKE